MTGEAGAATGVRRGVAVGVAVVVLGAGLVVVRAWTASRSEWAAGEALVVEYNRLPPAGASRVDDRPGERRAAILRDAIVHFREAALWYLPGNPYARRSLERLITVGQRAEQAASDGLALYAYRAARAAILGTRGLRASDEEALARANRAIARVSARLERPSAGAEAPSVATRERAFLAGLEPVSDPDPWFSLLAAAGLLGWIGGGLVFAVRGLDARCRLRAAVALRTAVVVVCGLGAWVAGLALA